VADVLLIAAWKGLRWSELREVRIRDFEAGSAADSPCQSCGTGGCGAKVTKSRAGGSGGGQVLRTDGFLVLEPHREQIGNFPRAYTHPALLDAAIHRRQSLQLHPPCAPRGQPSFPAQRKVAEGAMAAAHGIAITVAAN
jgi:hypothetical protein